MTCRECTDFLSDYLAGELEAELRATFERHLTACPNCLTYLQQLQQTITAGQQAYEDNAASSPPEVPEELIRAILAARRR